MMNVPNETDSVDGEAFIYSSNNPNVRLNFVRKVYGILSAQLLLTTLFVAMGMAFEDYQKFIENNSYLIVISAVVALSTSIALVCYRSVARTQPTNYILLGVFTLAESFLVSCSTAFVDANTVFIAAALTATVVVALTVYAMTTSRDITMCGGFLFAFGALLFVAAILSFFIRSHIFSIVIAAGSLCLFSLYLIYDVQLIMGDKKYAYGIDDYIVAALMLYIDIVRIFLSILQILAKSR